MTDPSRSPTSWKDLPGAPAEGTRLAAMDELADGGACLRSLENGPQPFNILLLRSGGQVFAYVNRCAHFGVPLAKTRQHLIIKPHESISCNVHYARYRWSDGLCVFGDCEGESLLPIPVVVSKGDVLIGGGR